MPSEHTDKIILKVFTSCSPTIHCPQFKVFVLIDACYHWKPFKELLISATSTSAPFPRPNCKALCVTTTSTTSAHPLLLGGDQGDRVTLQKSQPGRGQRHTVHTCPHMSTHLFKGTLVDSSLWSDTLIGLELWNPPTHCFRKKVMITKDSSLRVSLSSSLCQQKFQV